MTDAYLSQEAYVEFKQERKNKSYKWCLLPTGSCLWLCASHLFKESQSSLICSVILFHLPLLQKASGGDGKTAKLFRMTQRDGMEKEVGEGFRMGKTCKSMADSCQCMAKVTTIL